MRRLALLAAVLVLSMAVAACGGGSGTPATSGSGSGSGTGAGTGAGTGGGSVSLSVDANEPFAFAPSNLTVSAGQTVRLTLNNKGAIDHDLTVRGLDATTGLVATGASKVLTFTPTVAGSYEYYCAVPGHEAAGMKGTLTVS